MPMTLPQLKRTLRQLRHMELALRGARADSPGYEPLVWNGYFSTRTTRAIDSAPVKYPLSDLLDMGREEFKAALDDYFARLFAQTAGGESLASAALYDPQLLARLGLPPDAKSGELKQRFRALAKEYHPDWGGDSARFVELLELYERLTGGPG